MLSEFIKHLNAKKILFVAVPAVLVLALVLVFGIRGCQKSKNVPVPITGTSAEMQTPEPEIPTEPIIDSSETSEELAETQASESQTETDPETTKKQPYTYPVYETPTYYSYLTGLKCTRKEQRKRPVSIIINNIRDAMPNVGISKADIVYECTVEGGVTRLMMVLSDYEDVPVIGSVRSSREYFIDLSRTHDTIYVHAGGNPQDYDQFDIRPIDRMDGVNMNFPNTFYRDAERRKTMSLEHTLMTSGEGIVKGIEQKNYRTTYNSDYKGPFNFYEEFTDITGSGVANYVCVPYSNGFKPEFIYNPDDKLYYRKQFGAAHIDGATGEQIKFENVLVIFAEYSAYRANAIAIREGHLACKLTGAGYGFYITGGQYKIIKWQKETRESSLYLYETDNTKLYLNPGKSFICVTSTAYNKSVVINADIKEVK
ncbi:MAG: DUF3048 domain-containing protein [Oscillospiraceae bacterium]|nr:DUF3048 domain-containing protein [Oscillospiraceae bacterium]MCL2158774.1 DUF3048 domain-containing protein [Oscillospiraceae bacterium]